MRPFSKLALLAGAGWLAAMPALAQWYPAGRDSKLGTMLDQGLVHYQSPDLTLRLVRSSGTVAGLEAWMTESGAPKAADSEEKAQNSEKVFDFTPSELLAARSIDGYYHLGDLDLRLRRAGTVEWSGYSTALGA